MAGHLRHGLLCVQSLLIAAFVTGLSMGAPGEAMATAAGPDAWAVTGIRANGALNLRAEPSVHAAKIGNIPYNARGLANLGCTGEPTYEAWEKMNEVQRKQAKKQVWCRVTYQGVEGWVLGIYLREGR